MAVPPLPRTMRLQNKDGTVSADFARWWQLNVVATQAAEALATSAKVDAMTAKSQSSAAQSQAATAAAVASSAGANKPSGGVVGVGFSCTSGVRVTVASLSLAGVVAGTLRFDTTSFYGLLGEAEISPSGDFFGTFWITEQLTIGGAINDLYTSTWSGVNAQPGAYVFIDNQIALDAARPTAGILGDVTYRLQVARASGTNSLTSAKADFRAAQA